MYGAPARIVIVADKSAECWFIFDIDIVTRTIVPEVQECGLGTCIPCDTGAYPGEVQRIVGIPGYKLIIIGIAIACPDWGDPFNRLQTWRELVRELVTWCRTAKDGGKNNAGQH